MPHVSLTDITAFAGLGFGLSGFVLGVMNYLRDRPCVVVQLTWDLRVMGERPPENRYQVGTVRVTNKHRTTPVFITRAVIRSSRGFIVLRSVASGNRLAEGDAPERYRIEANDLKDYVNDWKRLRAEVLDSTGKTWRSKRERLKNPPTWVLDYQRAMKSATP